MTANTYIRTKIEPKIKNNARRVLDEIGLTMSAAIRLFITRVATEKTLPFAFDARDENGLTPSETAELLRRIAKVKAGKTKKNVRTKIPNQATQRAMRAAENREIEYCENLDELLK